MCIKIAFTTLALGFASLIALPLTVSTAEAGGRGQAHCNRAPGDFLGRDGKCHAGNSGAGASQRPSRLASRSRSRSSQRRNVAQFRNEQRDERFLAHLGNQPTGASNLAPVGAESAARNAEVYKGFSDRCQEQAAKRSQIHGVQVSPDVSGDMNSVARCKIDARFTESGAI
jgi:hypothetical protein